MDKVGARAAVTVTLEIHVPDSWGADCTVAQVHKQAKASALGMLRGLIEGRGDGSRYRIVGEPTASAVVVSP
jgi:hypothetical protein